MVNNGLSLGLPSGKLTVCYGSHCPVEIVDIPMNSMVNLHSYVNVYQRVPVSTPYQDASRVIL